MKCTICNQEQPSNYYFKEPGICLECAKKRNSDESSDNENSNYPKIILSTSPSIDGYQINKYIEVITSECVFGMNIFKDLFAGIRDVFGGRSKSTQKILRQTREVCLLELRKEASELDADAVIGIDLDYNEFSGGGKSMLFLVASGTAVKLVKNQNAIEI